SPAIPSVGRTNGPFATVTGRERKEAPPADSSVSADGAFPKWGCTGPPEPYFPSMQPSINRSPPMVCKELAGWARRCYDGSSMTSHDPQREKPSTSPTGGEVPDQRGALLYAALACTRVTSTEPEILLVRR